MIRTIAVCILTLLLSGRAHALESLDQFPRARLQIRTSAGQQQFDIWVANNNARAEQGLMFVRNLPVDQGMLFPLATPQVISMWMRNTLISLDMVFIDAHWRVVDLKQHATPMSDALITPDQPVKAVLELAAGEIARRQIRPGDPVQYIGGPARNWTPQ